MKVIDLCYKAASELNLPPKYVWEVYKSYWMAIRIHMSSQPLKGDLTEEEFNNLKPNVNIKSIGKFYITWKDFKSKKDNYERYNNKKD